MLARQRGEMDKKFKLNLNDKQLVKYIKLILIALLLVIEILVCAQYATVYRESQKIWGIIAVAACCFALTVLETLDSFAVKKFSLRMVFYGADSLLLLALCIITGNSYLSALYCVVLTQFYISVGEMKPNAILFGVSCGLFIISFVCGWVAVNKGASLYDSIVSISGDLIIGLFILGMHFAIVNFIIKFYGVNTHLSVALKQADESREQLADAYEELSRTAVYEERNRIAKDIHDNAGHSMTTVIMLTEAAKLLIDTDPQEAKSKIISANINAKNALEQMRESVHLLAGRAKARPLREEIEEIIAQTLDGTDLKIRCDLEDVSVDEEEYRFLCNSIKECLSNGIRHGKATAFYIELKKVFSEISLYISDNGCGAEGEIKEGFGLKGMRATAEKLGGRCSFSSEAGEGFEAEIILPIKKNNKKREKK